MTEAYEIPAFPLWGGVIIYGVGKHCFKPSLDAAHAMNREHSRMVALLLTLLALLAAPVAADQAAGWGEPVAGVQVRLLSPKARWNFGETPSLLAGVRNQGTRELAVAKVQELAEIEVDGRWYRWTGDVGVKNSTFPPWKEYAGVVFTLSDSWAATEGGARLKIEPGWHKVQVAFAARPGKAGDGLPVRAISNAVELEVLPAPLTADGQPVEGNMLVLSVRDGNVRLTVDDKELMAKDISLLASPPNAKGESVKAVWTVAGDEVRLTLGAKSTQAPRIVLDLRNGPRTSGAVQRGPKNRPSCGQFP